MGNNIHEFYDESTGTCTKTKSVHNLLDIYCGKKKNATNAHSKMGKFMGDALQYMTVSVQNTYRKKPRFFASGDGSACFMNAYFCQKLNIPLRLIIDTGVGNIRSTGLQNN